MRAALYLCVCRIKRLLRCCALVVSRASLCAWLRSFADLGPGCGLTPPGDATDSALGTNSPPPVAPNSGACPRFVIGQEGNVPHAVDPFTVRHGLRAGLGSHDGTLHAPADSAGKVFCAKRWRIPGALC